MKKSILILLLFLRVMVLHAQWRQLPVGSPLAGLSAVAVADSNVFVGSSGGLYGIYLSTNNGATWTSTDFGILYKTLCFTVKGSEFFAGTTNKGVIVSSDSGKTWTQCNPAFSATVNALAIKDSIIFAGGTGMFRSTDDGASWTTIENGLGYGQTTVTGLAVTEGKVLASTYAGVVLSTDNGNDWSGLVSTDSVNGVTNCIAAIDSTVLVGWNGGVIRSTDDGRSWIQGSSWIGTSNTFCFVGDSSRMYAGTTTGVHLSTDKGVTWTPINNGLPGNQVVSIAVEGTTLFAATTNNGVYRSIDSGTSWNWASSGMILTSVTSITGNGPNIYAVMSYNSLYSSTDNGASWIADTSLRSGVIASATVIGQNVYAMGHTGIYVSSDNGKTWGTINGGVMDTTHPSMLVQSGPNLISATQYSGRVFLSSDNGITWKNVGQALPELISLTASGSNVVAGSQSGVYTSTDNGETWTNVNDTLINITALAAAGSDVFAGRYSWPEPVSLPQSPPGGVFRSSDGGLTWSTINSGIPFDLQVYSITVHGEYVFAGAQYSGLYVSTITNDNWFNIGQDLPDSRPLLLFVNDSSVFGGTEESGIWCAPLSVVTGVKPPAASTLPRSFQLEQNFPNPFNPSTVISYQLRTNTLVTLKVYDDLGRLVKILVDARQTVGNHSVTLNASNLSSGVYFYRLTAGSFVETKKLMLLK
ncbi:MAG: T9SS type A sorting domain-containing protein [Bacteroidota bacterium]